MFARTLTWAASAGN
jgi:hypothetical protein